MAALRWQFGFRVRVRRHLARVCHGGGRRPAALSPTPGSPGDFGESRLSGLEVPVGVSTRTRAATGSEPRVGPGGGISRLGGVQCSPYRA